MLAAVGVDSTISAMYGSPPTALRVSVPLNWSASVIMSIGVFFSKRSTMALKMRPWMLW